MLAWFSHPNMAVCSFHFISIDSKLISVFDPCFCVISREMIPEPKERGKVCFMGFAIKTFLLYQTKTNDRREKPLCHLQKNSHKNTRLRMS